MPLPSPNLDDRDFKQLVDEARRIIQRSCPEWTDLTPGDPGMVLLEVFAFLTDTMIYRLNRLPEKAYIEFLRLTGIHLHSPAAASTILQFKRSRESDQPVEIPRGTRVTTDRPGGGKEPPVFVTTQTVAIQAGESEVEVIAHHAELIDAELVGTGTGLPGLVVKVHRPPVLAPAVGEVDLVVGVETTEDEVDEQAPLISYENKSYRIWREVNNFSNLGEDRFVYLIDRLDGAILFAPAARVEREAGELEDVPRALAEIPPNGREIRVWYRRGGGPEGNVAANVLTTLKDSLQGVEVSNPSPAAGGRAVETLANALVRGPQELHTLQRVVTARDFEFAALSQSAEVERVKALTRRELWMHGIPGEVDVLLVPNLPEEERGAGQVTMEALQARQTETARAEIQNVLDARRPLGTICLVNWTRYKTVSVDVNIVVRREEDQAAVAQRVTDRLYHVISPLPSRYSASGWPFGQALRASHVYDIALAEPGVLWVDQLHLNVEEAPNQAIDCIVADSSQPDTWFVGSGDTFFWSLNNGEGWEAMRRFPGEVIEGIATHREKPGYVAVMTRSASGSGSQVYVSTDLGDTWRGPMAILSFRINDLAWSLRTRDPVLLLATDSGLFEQDVQTGGSPVQVLVDAQNQDLGFYAVSVTRDVNGLINVAVAGQGTAGVYLSSQGGGSATFRLTGLKNEDIRSLGVQVRGARSFLWAGTAAAGTEDPGKGCFRWELRGNDDPPDKWRPFNKGYTGGSARSLAFLEDLILVASHRKGVLQLDTSKVDAAWQEPAADCGLPPRDLGRFQPVEAVSVDPKGQLIMAGTALGVYRSMDKGKKYQSVSSLVFADKVTLPPTWLFCSGKHKVSVVREEEAG